MNEIFATSSDKELEDIYSQHASRVTHAHHSCLTDDTMVDNTQARLIREQLLADEQNNERNPKDRVKRKAIVNSIFNRWSTRIQYKIDGYVGTLSS